MPKQNIGKIPSSGELKDNLGILRNQEKCFEIFYSGEYYIHVKSEHSIHFSRKKVDLILIT